MNVRLLIAGFFLLCNPQITIIDLLPDVLGCLMITRALAPVAAVSPAAETSHAAFRRLAVIQAVKAVAWIPMMALRSSDPSVTLLFTAGFAILTFLYLIPALNQLYAFVKLGSERCSAGLRFTGAMRVFTLVFLLLQQALAIFPETTYLYIDPNHLIYGTEAFPAVNYRGVLTVLAFALSLVIGLIGFTVLALYWRKVRKSPSFGRWISREIAAQPHDSAKTVLGSLRPALTLLSVAAFAAIGYTVDGMPVIPAFVMPLLILLALRRIGRVIDLPKKTSRLPLAATVVSALSYLTVLIFCILYQDRAAVGFVLVRKAFLLPLLTETASALLIILCLLRTVRPILCSLITAHTGAFWEKAFLTHNSATAKERQALITRAGTVTALLALTVAINAVTYAFLYVIPLLRLFGALVGLATALYASSYVSALRLAVQEKYADPHA